MKNKYLIKSRNSWANADYEDIIEASSEKEAKEIFKKENRGCSIIGFPKLVNDNQEIGTKKVLNEAMAEEMLYEIDNSGSDTIVLKEGFSEKTEFSRKDLLAALPHLKK